VIAAFRKWRAERAEKRKEKLHIAGYDWAAGMLLRGATEDELDLYINAPFDRNEFERGAKEAMRDFAMLRAREVQS
jgi:hypothetical protein